jgi:hypothetical protein
MIIQQHRINRDNPPITDAMTSGHEGWAHGTGMHALIGRTVVTAYDVPDSDRGESLLLLDNGTVLLVSCDPGYDDNDQRTPDAWECCMYDATDTQAGRAIKELDTGHWL